MSGFYVPRRGTSPPPALSSHKAMREEYPGAGKHRFIHLSTAIHKRKRTKKKTSTAPAHFHPRTPHTNIQGAVVSPAPSRPQAAARPESARKAFSPRSEFLIGPVMAGHSAIPGSCCKHGGALDATQRDRKRQDVASTLAANVDAASCRVSYVRIRARGLSLYSTSCPDEVWGFSIAAPHQRGWGAGRRGRDDRAYFSIARTE